MNPNQLVTKLTFAEVNSRYAPDCQRVIREEREALSAALQSGNGAKIAAAVTEARRVAAMWSVDLD